jgi:hypothetical protein
MPLIPQYEVTDAGIRPTEVGIEATAGAARRVNAAYNEAAGVKSEAGAKIGSGIASLGAAAVQWQEDREKSQGAAAFAGIQAASVQKWNDLNKNADPNNPLVAQSYLQSLEGDLQKFKNSFITEGGQQWAEHHIDTLRDHMFKKATADRASAAGHAAVTNAATTVNNLADAAYSDPSKSGPELQFSTISTALPKGLQEDAYSTIAQNAARGYIRQNGEMPPWANDPKYFRYLDHEKLDTLLDRQVRSNEIKQKQYESLQKKAEDKAVTNTEKQAHDNFVKFDPETNRYLIDPAYLDQADKIRDMPGGEKTANAMERFVQRQRDKRAVVNDDPAVHSDLLERMVTPTDHPTTKLEILEANDSKKISDKSTSRLIAIYNATQKEPISDPVMKAALSGAKALLGNDPVGRGKYASFVQDFIPQYLQLPQNERMTALDFKNPNSFINKTIGSYQRDLSTKMIDKVMQGTTPPTTPAASGTFTPPPGSLFNAARQQYKFPDGSIHDATGAAVKAPPVVPASQ